MPLPDRTFGINRKRSILWLFSAKRCSAAAVAVAGASGAASAAEISGAGATFPYPIYAKWADAYKQKTGTALNYQSIGSGGGIKQITAEDRRFRRQRHAAQRRAVAEGRSRAMADGDGRRRAGRQSARASSRASSSSTARRWPRSISARSQKWNDPKIAQLNPGVNLPDKAIAPVYRSDGSGTTFLFTDYLSKVDPEFKQKVGAGTSVQFPAGIGAQGQRGCRRDGRPHRRRDRLCRICLRAAEQDDLHADEEPRRQVRRARKSRPFRPPPPAPTGPASPVSASC